jgi:hypothetical protein
MRLMKHVTLLVAFLFMAAGAYGQDVHYNYDRSANFASYKTYKWVEIPGGSVPDPLIHQAIMQASEEQLAPERSDEGPRQAGPLHRLSSCDQPGEERGPI